MSLLNHEADFSLNSCSVLTVLLSLSIFYSYSSNYLCTTFYF